MLRRPALDPATVAPRTGSMYPEPFRSRVLPREKRALGDALGLTKIGINLTTLGPGKESSMRHHHTHEDEFVYVLEGEVVLRTDAGVPDDDLGLERDAAGGYAFTHKDGRPY